LEAVDPAFPSEGGHPEAVNEDNGWFERGCAVATPFMFEVTCLKDKIFIFLVVAALAVVEEPSRTFEHFT
jgi:hypothetical protein